MTPNGRRAARACSRSSWRRRSSSRPRSSATITCSWRSPVTRPTRWRRSSPTRTAASTTARCRWRSGGCSGRPALGSAPFAALALALHAGVAALTALLLRAPAGRPPSPRAAARWMLIAPQNLEAAYWFSASTDLLATAFVLASLLRRSRPIASWPRRPPRSPPTCRRNRPTCCRCSRCWCLPASLAAPARGVAPQPGCWPSCWRARRGAARLGWGRGPARRARGEALQLAAGLGHLFTGNGALPEPLAFALGAAIVALTGSRRSRRQRRRPARVTPLVFCALAVAPLFAAGWALGARYFYLPSVGFAWAVAEALAGAGRRRARDDPACCSSVGGLQAAKRRGDVVSYDRRVAAARRAVAAGPGVRTPRVPHQSGIKDLDLAVKQHRALARGAGDVLVLNDVPASFAIVPAELRGGRAPLVAQPPLPPSGAYRFGDVRSSGSRAATTADAARGRRALPRHPLRPPAPPAERPDHRPRCHRRDQRALDAERLDDGMQGKIDRHGGSREHPVPAASARPGRASTTTR